VRNQNNRTFSESLKTLKLSESNSITSSSIIACKQWLLDYNLNEVEVLNNVKLSLDFEISLLQENVACFWREKVVACDT
jgi:hypothetical protein